MITTLLNQRRLFHIFIISLAASIIGIGTFSIVSATAYVAEISFALPDSVFIINESISFIGSVSLANYSDNGTLQASSAKLANAVVNITFENSTGTTVSNYTFTTDASGNFFSNSTFNLTAKTVKAPTTAGKYNLKASYKDPNNGTWFSTANIQVVNQTIDVLQVSAQKAVYNPSETISIIAEAIKVIGDKVSYVSNVSVNGSLRNATQAVISMFNCTTGSNGHCTTSVRRRRWMPLWWRRRSWGS